MEAGGIPLREWITDKLSGFDSRIRSNHDSIGKVRERQGKQQEKLIKIESTLNDLKEDMGEMKNTLRWIMRGLFGAIAVGLMFVVAVGTLIIQAAG